jgi:hypothetical protein
VEVLQDRQGVGARGRGCGGWFLDPQRADHRCGQFRLVDRLKEMTVDARGEAEAVGVTFHPIVSYPVNWTI